MFKKIIYVLVLPIILCVSTSSYAVTCKYTCTGVTKTVGNNYYYCDAYHGAPGNCTFFNPFNCCNTHSCICPVNLYKVH